VKLRTSFSVGTERPVFLPTQSFLMQKSNELRGHGASGSSTDFSAAKMRPDIDAQIWCIGISRGEMDRFATVESAQ
jgi:hypothetical protein